jgi:hypothetical protein
MYGSEPSLSAVLHSAIGRVASASPPVVASNPMLEGRRSWWIAPRACSAASSLAMRIASGRKSWTGIGAPVS